MPPQQLTASGPQPRVVAVVVAYNRQELLAESLDGLAGQTRPLDAIVVVDNASSDDSVAVAQAHRAAPHIVALTENTGGAGGFTAGLVAALDAESADLVWLMDDDTIPTPTALEELLSALDAYPGPVAILGSRVVWHDGRDHPMNTPRLRPGASGVQIARARAAGAIPVRSSSFVSMLIDAKAIRYYGLPIADYFIWNDDFEYSCRLLRHSTGLHVRGSVVEHRTKKFGATDADPGERFYYEVRNKLWMFRWSSALSPAEKLLYGGSTAVTWCRTLAGSANRPVLVRAAVRGLRDGLCRRPRSTEQVMRDSGLSPARLTAIEGPSERRSPR